MKVGILSMQMVNNYGSLLQAYGLKKTIESFGNVVEFIDIKKNEAEYSLLRTNAEDYKDESDGRSKFRKLFDKDVLARIKNKRYNKKFEEECRRFRCDYLCIDKKSDMYDVCVIGSDEVFNCLNSGWWGYTSQLFGNVSEAKTVITYAASCGATTYKNIPEEVSNSISKSLKKLSGLSVRDNNTLEFVKHYVDINAVINLDPVLIYDFTSEISKAILPRLPEKYCIIYSYSYRFYKKDEIDAITAFCKRHNLTPVALQGGQTWCENFIACSPFSCLRIFQNADFVITDTFHGTIFSVKYAKRFAVVLRESNVNKLGDLVMRLGIEKHLLSDMSELENVFLIEKDIMDIQLILEAERNKTIDYLREFIYG